ncbi:MAG: hypothetical protein OEY79_04765 [Anaplasmataceae bacterium]|nr:hypothetical protein [Anaplasmataceae bacterium]
MYDIRGIFNKDFSLKDVYNIANYININKKIKTIAIGYDSRYTSVLLLSALYLGLNKDKKIISLGMITTPILCFAIDKLKADCAIMITASHNPIIYNGFKIFYQNKTVFGNALKKFLKPLNYKITRPSNITKVDITNDYISHIFKIQNNLNKKIIWNGGGTITSVIIQKLLEKINNKNYFAINNELNKYAAIDPTIEKYQVQSRESVKLHNADFAFIFDGDCDRLIIMDKNGDILSAEEILFLLKDIYKKCVVETKISRNTINYIEKNYNKEFFIVKTGHPYLKIGINKYSADFAIDISGHMIFADNKYDDALYAAVKIINYLDNNKLNFKNYISKELRINCSNKDKIMNKIFFFIKKNSYNYKIFDGIEINIFDGWLLIRQSNTEGLISIRYENTDLLLYNKMQNWINHNIISIIT